MIDETVLWLQQMHQIQQDQDFTLCPVQFESDFEREFGAGDEQQARPARIDQVQFEHGHIDGNFC